MEPFRQFESPGASGRAYCVLKKNGIHISVPEPLVLNIYLHLALLCLRPCLGLRPSLPVSKESPFQILEITLCATPSFYYFWLVLDPSSNRPTDYPPGFLNWLQ
ncbi:hypothetical protein NPIL_255981 [Nephila pilipes]|uniref:Uncharacterized protein n=1 Tax=Nephila pilipes TaxID=299642 RepID=A0A8X6TRB6_NEPPI|nr:hypothetical protein NPIL_255981 [Nephila pilipes]